MRSAFAMVALGLLTSVAQHAQAAPLVLGGDWQLFSWADGPGVWNTEGPFTFDTADWTDLALTDIGADGDQFEVYDGLSVLGATSVPSDNGVGTVIIPFAFEDPRWSSGAFLLAPGAHSIRIKTIRVNTALPGALPDGVGYLRLNATDAVPTPVPSGILLAMIGAGLVLRHGRRRV